MIPGRPFIKGIKACDTLMDLWEILTLNLKKKTLWVIRYILFPEKFSNYIYKYTYMVYVGTDAWDGNMKIYSTQIWQIYF